MVKRWILIYILCAAMIFLAAFYGSPAVTVMENSVMPPKNSCIIIDAGHGGVDGGATSCKGTLESGINLQIALRLNDLLRLLGHSTIMIRTTDITVAPKGETIAQKKIYDLRERVRIANSEPNALLISIHQNTFSDSRYSGAQVFYAKTKNSDLLAKQLQEAFCNSINTGSERKSKGAKGVYLMEHVECTAILVECGFLSNLQEATALEEPEYQKKLCCVIGATVSQFLYGA